MGHTLRTCEFAASESVVLLTMLPGVDVTAEDAHAIVATATRLVGEQRRPLLVDMRRMHSLDRGAREYFKSDTATRPTLGEHRVPTRMFTDEKAARAWLVAAR